MKTIKHQFGPGDTIQGIIRKYNRHDMPQEFVDMLTEEFNKLNDEKAKVPRVGEVFVIPVHHFTDEDLKKFPSQEPPKEVKRKTPPIKNVEESGPIEVAEGYIIPEIKRIDTLDLQEYMKSDEMKAILHRQNRREKARKAIAEGKPLPVYRKKSTELVGKPVEEEPVEKKVEKKKAPPKPKKVIKTNFEEKKPEVPEVKEEKKTRAKRPTRISRVKKTEEKQEDLRVFHRKRPTRVRR